MTHSSPQRIAMKLMHIAILSLIPATSLASPRPPEESTEVHNAPKRAKRELAAGGVFLALGFAAELSGAVISTRCTAGRPCAGGIAIAIGEPDGPSRYTLVSTGPSSLYIAGRLVAAPLLITGFTITMIGVASLGEHTSNWQHSKRRRLAWSLFGAGIGVLTVSRVVRAVFLSTGICQAPMCVHGVDQGSLWIGRGLTFAGTGLLVRDSAKRTELGVSSGPSNSFGLSFTGRF